MAKSYSFFSKKSDNVVCMLIWRLVSLPLSMMFPNVPLQTESDVDIISCLLRSLLTGLRECATDDDVAMHLIKHTEDFEKYLHYMVGQAQAEACVTDKAMQQYFKVYTQSVLNMIKT